MKKSTVWLYIGLALWLLGGVLLVLEHHFYQYVDVNGVLHESLFLPLGVLSFVLGGSVLSVTLLYRLLSNLKTHPGPSDTSC
ncbi:DUF3955 domain-containing protein [Bowmanella sp. Y26]|uniref:DUF3955 domain-containing protein n=1 Tax=Bowmanella yangjiangensis TaxID=2811230 RepID=A0ABS3CV12_9ALTE|nr:DUF3955 domain-containing protein [Bowmanella yangjiangensis]MBN7820150.1 DUF3955 domain-containing protein [Bowmanella yangjiangensis]MBT1065384.1 DUF3955 domain-containing protein [Bowmanella yangjiangensis]